MTGAYSRSKSNELLGYYISQAQKQGTTFSVIMIDVDKLKYVNDNFGHHMGDEVLCQTVDLLQSNLRENDFLGRWGGDEFLLICPDTDGQKTSLLANRLKQTVVQEDFSAIGNLSISVGVATYHPDETLESLLKRADSTMYLQKKNRRKQ